MARIRWAIFLAVVILLTTVCRLNVHQRHFNLFISGLLLLTFVVTVVFWLMCRSQGVKDIQSIEENDQPDAHIERGNQIPGK